MNKEQLKKTLKPLIKECIKEALFEEGFLSTIISEVLKGAGSSSLVENNRRTEKTLETKNEHLQRQETLKQESLNKRKRLLDAIGRSTMNGVDLFEGTTPLPSGGNLSESTPAGAGYALSDVDPNDPGVDLSVFGFSSSKKFKF